MHSRHVFRVFLGVLALSTSLAWSPGCVASTRGRLYVQVGPPRPLLEVRAVAPGPGYVWLQGYHRWDGRTYVWVPGYWQIAPRPRAVWVPGHWERDRRGWYFIDGRWQ
jgi:hypothetical protein